VLILFALPFLVLEDLSGFQVDELVLEELSEFVLIIDFLLFGVSDGGFFVDFF
jgi:hypothetical protein